MLTILPAHEDGSVRHDASLTERWRCLDQILAFVGRLTLEGVLTEANEPPLKAAGLTAADVIGRPFWDCYWWSYDAAIQNQLKDAVCKAANGEVVRYDVPVRVAGGAMIVIDFQLAPVYDAAGTLIELIASGVDITARVEAETELARSEARFRFITDWLPLIVWLHDAEGKQVFVNQTFCNYFAVTREEMLGDGWRMALHADDQAPYCEAFAHAVRSQAPFHAEARVRNGRGDWRWIESWSNPLINEDGKYIGQVGTSADITERKHAQARSDMLARELNHRVKNMMAKIQAIASQTGRTAGSIQAFLASFDGRLRSLATAQDLIVHGDTNLVQIRTLIEQQLGPLAREDQIELSGGPVALDVETAVDLALVLHEMGTNALKYGALSNENGRVQITWQVSSHDAREVTLSWIERGGPPVKQPQRRGFGTRLLHMGLANGRSEAKFEPEGLQATLRFQLKQVESPTRWAEPSSPIESGNA